MSRERRAARVANVSTIMLIEDTVDDEALALEALRRAGVSQPVVIARDGAQAIDLLLPTRAGATPLAPAFVLLDLKLPAMSGLDVLKRLRADERTKALPIIVLAASRDPVDVAACYDEGANSYVAKPSDLDAFVRVMQQIANYWLRLNEPPSAPA